MQTITAYGPGMDAVQHGRGLDVMAIQATVVKVTDVPQ